MNQPQNAKYIAEGLKAFQAVPEKEAIRLPHQNRDVSFENFRHDEVAYALGKPTSFRDFSELDLTCCLFHFAALQMGDRLPPKLILELATQHQEGGLLESFRKLWDSVDPVKRADTLRDRFSLMFFEQIPQLASRDRYFLRITLTRLSKQYPRSRAVGNGETPCAAGAAHQGKPSGEGEGNHMNVTGAAPTLKESPCTTA